MGGEKNTQKSKEQGEELFSPPRFFVRPFSLSLGSRYLPLHGSPRMTTLHVHVTFLYISLPSLKGYDVKVPNRNVF